MGFSLESAPNITRLRALANAWTATNTFNDNVLLRWGTDGDIGSLNRSTTLAANTALTGVLVGTPVTPVAIAANSFITGNITASGDYLIAVNKGGTSYMAFMADASTGDTLIGVPTGQSFDVYIAGTKEIDYATGALAFQQATTISTTATTLTLNPSTNVLIANTKNLLPATSDGSQLGSGTLMWSDLFLASGAVINFNNGNLTLTHSANTLALAGGVLSIARSSSNISITPTDTGSLPSTLVTFSTSNAGAITFTIGSMGSGNNNAGKDFTVTAGAAGTSTTGAAGGAVNLTAGAAGGTGNNAGGRIILTTGAATGTGLKPLVELDAAGGVPTTAVLTSGFVGFKYNAGGTLVAYVNDGGTVKSLSLGTPA